LRDVGSRDNYNYPEAKHNGTVHWGFQAKTNQAMIHLKLASQSP
jgi:hypothetical protein